MKLPTRPALPASARHKIAVLLLTVLAACSMRYGTVTLTWDPVENDKVTGYNVYRAEELDGDYRRVNADLLTEPLHVDRTTVSGKTYYYRVTAVTSAGVESEASETVTKTID